MFKVIEKYTKDELKRIMFIELKEDAEILGERFNMLKNVPIPINMKELVGIVKGEKDESKISLASMAEGMIMLIGLDCDFKYVDVYKKFLYDFDEKIEEYICYEGLKFAERNEFYDALIYFKALCILNKKNINGLYNYARCCQDIVVKSEDIEEKKDFKRDAIEALEIITEEYPEFYQAYYHLGFHYANQNLFKKAQITWEKCLDLDVDDEKRKDILLKIGELKDHIQYEEGYTLILNGQYELGLEKLKPLLEKYSDWWNLMFFVGLGYRGLNNPEEAINYFKKILMVKPTQVDAINELGLCYAMIRDFEKAEKYFSKALQFEGENGEILCNLGILYMEMKKIDLAKDVLTKALSINPDDEITKQCIRELNRIHKA